VVVGSLARRTRLRPRRPHRRRGREGREVRGALRSAARWTRSHRNRGHCQHILSAHTVSLATADCPDDGATGVYLDTGYSLDMRDMRYMRYMRCALVMGYGVTWLWVLVHGCCPSIAVGAALLLPWVGPSRMPSRMPWVSLEVYDGYDG
jgi:hypothetical protein